MLTNAAPVALAADHQPRESSSNQEQNQAPNQLVPNVELRSFRPQPRSASSSNQAHQAPNQPVPNILGRLPDLDVESVTTSSQASNGSLDSDLEQLDIISCFKHLIDVDYHNQFCKENINKLLNQCSNTTQKDDFYLTLLSVYQSSLGLEVGKIDGLDDSIVLFINFFLRLHTDPITDRVLQGLSFLSSCAICTYLFRQDELKITTRKCIKDIDLKTLNPKTYEDLISCIHINNLQSPLIEILGKLKSIRSKSKIPDLWRHPFVKIMEDIENRESRLNLQELNNLNERLSVPLCFYDRYFLLLHSDTALQKLGFEDMYKAVGFGILTVLCEIGTGSLLTIDSENDDYILPAFCLNVFGCFFGLYSARLLYQGTNDQLLSYRDKIEKLHSQAYKPLYNKLSFTYCVGKYIASYQAFNILIDWISSEGGLKQILDFMHIDCEGQPQLFPICPDESDNQPVFFTAISFIASSVSFLYGIRLVYLSHQYLSNTCKDLELETELLVQLVQPLSELVITVTGSQSETFEKVDPS